MRILDRERYWAFFKAYVICFIALVGLYVVIDAFSNVDEFAKRASGIELFKIMGRFYLVHMSLFYDRLCGVIGMMAAIFTVTWMQRNNELLAMLAAGISTQRVIRPVWVSTIIVSLLAMANQELIMPPYAEELRKSHDDDGTRMITVSSRYDAESILIHGNSADRASNTIFPCDVTIPVPVYGMIYELSAEQAQYIPADHPRAPLKGGWLLRSATLNPPAKEGELGDGPLKLVKDPDGFPPPFKGAGFAGRETYFLESGLTFKAVARGRDWYQYATTPELIRSLSDPSNHSSEKLDIGVFLHSRLLRPLASLSLMMLSLPLVLGGYGRNMFINLGLSLGTSAVFYGASFLSQYLGSHAVIAAEMAAWAPLIVFGTLAVARWDTIRT
jgi:lipopolysaccharide export system permease protein